MKTKLAITVISFLGLISFSPVAMAGAKIEITANDQMQFDKKVIEVTAGEEVTLVFTNVGKLPKAAMGHNVVILKPDSDIMAFGALDAIRSGLKLRVPEDVSIIGFDDIPMASWPSFNLTTVRQPVRSMVDASVEDLISRIKKPDIPPNHKVIMGELIIRGSSKLSRKASQNK